MRFPPRVKYLLPEVRDAFIFELVLNVLLAASFTRRQQPPPDDTDDTETFCEKKLMMTERERERVYMRIKMWIKWKNWMPLTFSPKKQSFCSNRGSVIRSLSFFFLGRFEEHATRAFRRPPLVGLQNNTRDFYRSRRVRVSKHTHTPTSLSDLTPCLFSRPRRRRHWEEEKRAADGRV